MKVLCFIDCLGAGGAQRQMVGLAGLLQQEVDQLKVCYYYDIPFFTPILETKNIEHEKIPISSNIFLRVFAIAYYFYKEKPDCVIAYLETPSLIACLAKLMGNNYRLIVSERNITRKIGLKDRARFFCFRFADKIVPNSFCQASFLCKTYPWMSNRIKTIPNFVDLDVFSFHRHQKSSIPLFLVVATLWPPKNALGLIKAAALLKEKGVAFQIHWYGVIENNYHGECEKAIRENQLDQEFKLFAKTKNIQQEYNKADYFCLPSFYEGTPNALCEALSCGLPVVCSNVSDNAIYIKDGKNGFLFDPNNPVEIANKMLQLLSLKDCEYEKYCLESRRIAESSFSKKTFINAYRELL